MLNVQITSADKGSLYTLQIDNTQLDDSKNIGGYAASLSGVGLETPLTVKLRKFNRSLGAVKLTSRVLGRIFRKHMDKLVTAAPAASGTKTRKTRVAKTPAPVAAAPEPVTAGADHQI
jgi:hypothetical protein